MRSYSVSTPQNALRTIVVAPCPETSVSRMDAFKQPPPPIDRPLNSCRSMDLPIAEDLTELQGYYLGDQNLPNEHFGRQSRRSYDQRAEPKQFARSRLLDSAIRWRPLG